MSPQLLALSAIVNQSIVNQKIVFHVPVSRKIYMFLKLLRAQGFISDFEITTQKQQSYRISLLYNKQGSSVLRNIYPISKPSRRIYVTVKQLQKFQKSTIILIVSTTKGLLTAADALKFNLGGELFCILS